MFENIREIILSDKTKAGRFFDLFIVFLILISIFEFTIDTLPDLPEFWIQVIEVSELLIVIIFTIEYLLRLIVIENKLKFVFSFYGIIDLLAILPFYIATGIDLRSIRVFRLLRVIRVFKLFRYSRALQRYKNAFLSIRSELTLFFFATLFVIYLSSVGIYYFEHDAQPDKFVSIFDAIWWSVITLTTVGYGDVFPITLGGKIFTGFVVIIGLGVVAVPTGLFAAALGKAAKKNDD